MRKVTIKYWLKQYYDSITNFGRCSMILDQKDKELLELIYEEENFYNSLQEQTYNKNQSLTTSHSKEENQVQITQAILSDRRV
ncbi:hypothetical protein PMALA_053570 [Plasmodium malariae]|uniref:PIR Superfamily Protein n=1 Tax=Plasmodium malariae TaxID=5858 RepID=A0A1A8WWY7_PLAMA|nr:hypothetical protein PMALA_053570 [Plasmodium malariae]